MSVLAGAATAVLGIQVPAQAASSAPAAPADSTSSHQLLEPACATPKAGQFTCYALRRTDIKPSKGVQPSVTPAGWGATDLQSAYNLSANGGAGQTVAIVDAFDDPNAEADLAVYRAQYGLPECTTANGCFSKVDQRGGTSYPTPDPGWAGEISLDLDMVSAIAPNAHILLVEADDNGFDSLGSSVNEAVALGAKFVSNSYGSDYRGGNGEDPSETTVLDTYYNHPGVAVTVSTGDYAYGVGYPAASQYVTAVGGTTLARDTSTARGWTESAWNDAGSGCSQYEPKPAWQHDTGCDKRSLADVSAVAANVAVYQTYGDTGWDVYGGTSVSSPIIASVYADAGSPVAGTYPNSYPYAAASGINDVTTGSNGSCTPSYLCNGTAGYDGPTGLGTPDGVAAFRTGPHGVLSGTVTDASTGKPVLGATVTAGTDSARTDASGAYTLPVPAGTYDVGVEAFGYTTATATGVDVGDGGTVTKSFALTPVPNHTVSGKVTDGSGHGWPLYAKITADGAPGSVWTDPATGDYSVTLPEGHDYTLHVTASNPGYQSVSRTVTVGSGDQTVNLPVPADPWATTAAGYRVDTAGTTEPFDATDAPPAGWSVVDADGTTGGWEFDDPGNRTNRTGGTGAFAVVDSDHFGGAASQDTQLISPAYDFTGKNNPELAFDTQYQAYNGQSAEVDATSDGGATWTKVWSTTTSVAGPARIEVPLSGFAGRPAVQFRFHFVSHFGWWWSVDDVFVGDRELAPTPGALVVGTVSDANTGDGVVGATVTDGTDATRTATTVATPDDPELGDGYYSLFDTTLGSHDFAAAKGHYTTLSRSVDVAADDAVEADFSLQAGKITVTPAPLAASVPWGGSTKQTLTVKNTGGAPATVKLGEQSGGFRIQAAGAPLISVKGDYSALSSKAHQVAGATAPTAGPSDGAWAPAPDFPGAIMDNAVSAYDGKVYSAFGFTGSADTSDMYALDPVAGTWSKLAGASDTRESPAHGFIDGKFYAAGGWGPTGAPDPKLEIYDPESDSWTTGASAPKPYAGSGTAVLDGRLYMIGGCGATSCGTTDASAYDAASDSWSAIAPYPEPVSWEACGAVNELIYCAGGLSASNADIAHTYVYDPSVNTWSQLADMPATQWASSYTAANGQLLLAGGVSNNALSNRAQAFDPVAGTWSALPNPATPTYRGGGAPGFYKVGGGDAPSHPSGTVELLAGYDQVGPSDVTWLGESTQALTVQPGASAQVTVTFDASVPEVAQPGDYDAQLAVGTDTPYAVPRVPVTLHVAPPRTWGKITGTVRGVTTTGGTAPLAGATVEIVAGPTSYTLVTGADGTYALWLDTHNNNITVIAAKDGYQPATTTAKIQKGATTTTDFTL